MSSIGSTDEYMVNLTFATELVENLLDSQPELMDYPEYLIAVIRLTCLQAKELRLVTSDVEKYLSNMQNQETKKFVSNVLMQMKEDSGSLLKKPTAVRSNSSNLNSKSN